MAMRNGIAELRWGRLALVLVGFVVVYLVGSFLADMVVHQFDFVMHVRSEPTLHLMIMTATAIYMVLMAIPFMPGAEIGAKERPAPWPALPLPPLGRSAT